MSSPKARDYFITINQNAESYDEALSILNELNYSLYAYIVHDKDMLYNEETGEATNKATHKHIVVELKNPVTFQSIQNKFKGAHIERVKYKKSAYQYLLHESPHSGEKYQYDISEIVSNQIDAVRAAISAEEGLELFKETEFLLYIAQGTRTPYQFTKRFGLNAYKQYWRPYSEMLAQLESDEEMQADLYSLQQSLTLEAATQLFGNELEVEE